MSKNPDRIRLAVGIPAYGGNVSAHHCRMWTEFGNTLGGSLERFELVTFDYFDVNGIDQCRNLMLVRAIEAQADWLLMIDADTWVEPSKEDQQAQSDAGFLLLRMISEAARISDAAPSRIGAVVAPVMSRVVPGKDVPHQMAYVEQHWETTEARFDGKPPARSGTTFEPIEFGAKGGMTEIDRAATAVFALNVPFAVEHRLSFKFDGKLSEDHFYCKSVREAGGRILADTRVRTGHMSRQTPLYSR